MVTGKRSIMTGYGLDYPGFESRHGHGI